MPGLDNLVLKIKQNGSDKADQIINNANEEAARIIADKTGEAELYRKELLSESNVGAERLKERIISDKTLELRDKIIYAKREAIKRVFDEAVKRLDNLPADKFKDFVIRRLSGAKLSGEAEIILPAKYAKLSIDEINAGIKKNGGTLTVKPYKGKRAISGGFILISSGVEQNETFRALADYYQDELETVVIQNLF